ncbi:VWA domain-containing protein [Jannaschia sp. R86511]|uniref:vWA domain-containing protein n=1 Tax=Jannaschia sp. R86511 TaxID=3093853 RepID=UPI0036D33E57
MTRTRPTGLVPVLALAVLAAGLAAPAAAATAPATSETPELVVVLDSSGSMAETDAGNGQTRMDAAKQAVTDLATSTPDTTRIGLRTYGDGVDSQAPGSCEDTTLRVPVGPVDRDALTTQVDDLTPRGDTPIGTALLAAATDFTGTGPQSVVLVSDGEPTCDPDPCPVAAQLADQGIDLRIDVIGLLVDDTARDVLQCIADAGNGTYVDATDAAELTTALDTAAERSSRVYEAEGAPVEGSATPAGAPQLEPGLYRDAFAPDETRHYVVDVPAGATAHLAATAVRDGDGADIRAGRGQLELQTTAGEARCSDAFSTGGTSGVEGPVTAALRHGPYVGQAIGERDVACDAGGPVVLAVEWTGTEGDPPTEMELLVLVEDPLAPGADPGTAVAEDTDAVSAEPAGEVVGPVEGGASFVTAKPVRPGGYEDTIRPGETLFYKVDVGWGQQLSARADIAAIDRDSAEGEALGDSVRGPWLSMELFGPARAAVIGARPDAGASATSFVVPGLPSDVGAGTVPVLFANRTEAVDDRIAAASLAGEHYVAFTLGRSEAQDPDEVGVAIPFVLSVGVTGEVVDAPAYQAAAAPAPSATAEPDDPAPAGTSAPTSEPASPPVALDDAAPASQDTGPLVVTLVVIAVLLTAALVALFVYGARSTRRGRAQASP